MQWADCLSLSRRLRAAAALGCQHPSRSHNVRGHVVRNVFTSIAALALGAFSAVALPAAPAARLSESQALLARIAGVYKERFRNEIVSGEKSASENILEVVPVDDAHAYVRMHLEFYNGHLGAIYGIAAVANYDRTPGCRGYHGARVKSAMTDFRTRRTTGTVDLD
jgi:hypothetical protein